MTVLNIGQASEETITVTKDMAVDFMGERGRVLSTPSMIQLMEQRCRLMIKPYLDSTQESVGTKVNVQHLSAVPVGKNVMVKATLTQAEGRRCVFTVEAFHNQTKVGEGSHERFIVDLEEFLRRISTE
ncbi:MAG: thioesterase family protein [Nitrososphaerales archaeon]